MVHGRPQYRGGILGVGVGAAHVDANSHYQRVTVKLAAKTLLKRMIYGGRKGRRAWRRLLGYTVSELEAGGVTMELDFEAKKLNLRVPHP